MKSLSLAVFLFFLAGNLLAQDPAYKGPAKIYIKSFFTQLEKLKSGTATASTVMNAERALRSIKEADPHYNTAEMEAALKPWKEKKANEEKAILSEQENKETERQYFSGFYGKLIAVYSSGNDIEPGMTGKTYFDKITELDLPTYKTKRNLLGEVDPRSYPALIDKALADYDNYLERSERMKWDIVRPMADLRNMANPQEKIKKLENIKYECEGVLMLSPNNTAFKQKLEEIKKMLGSSEGEAAKFFTGDFHKQHVNQIIWSTKPMVIGKENEMTGSIKESFKTGDYIYGTAYLGLNASAAMEGNSHLRVRIRIDDGTAIWGGDLSYIDLPVSEQNKSTIQFALIPDAQWIRDHYGPYLAAENWTLSYFLDELSKSGDITHEISMELIFPTSKIRDIKSKFTLDLGGGSEAIKAQAAKLHAGLMDSRELPRAGMQNPALEKQLLAIMEKLPGWNEKFNKAIITGSGWSTKKNELTGAILYRYIAVVGTCRSTEGKCYVQEFTFKQDYSGGGHYENAVKYNSYGGKWEIGCDKIK